MRAEMNVVIQADCTLMSWLTNILVSKLSLMKFTNTNFHKDLLRVFPVVVLRETGGHVSKFKLFLAAHN